MKKRLLAIMLVIAMVFTMGITVFADGTGSASITINGTTSGNTYTLYKVFDATFGGTAQNPSVAYTYVKGKNTTRDAAFTGSSSPFELKQNADNTDVYSAYIKSGKSEYDVAQFLKSYAAQLDKVKTTKATGETVEFTGLPQGYYLILSEDGSGNSVVTGILTVEGNETVNAKEKTPEPKKVIIIDGEEVTDASAFYGDTVKYKISLDTAVNSYDGKKIKEYVVCDKMGEGLTNLTNITVKVGNITVGEYSASNPYGYTYEPQDGAVDATITIPWVDSSENFLYDGVSAIVVECEATVSENASIGNETNTNTNSAKINWNYVDDTEHDNDSYVNTTINVYAVSVYKSDSKGNPLSGAVFNLLDKDGNKITFKAVAGETGVYCYSTDADAITEAVTPASGIITIKGIKSDTTTSYKLREVTAPSGYNLLESDVPVSAAEFTSSSTTQTIYIDSEGNITEDAGKAKVTKTITYTESSANKNIVNNIGTELPETGGIGTTIFYIIGGIIVLGAIVFFVTRRRMDSNNKA